MARSSLITCLLLSLLFSCIKAQAQRLRGLAEEFDVPANPDAWDGVTYPNCQWHVKYSFNASPQGYIDPDAVYYAQIIQGARVGISYKIKGRFPPVDYLSWQLYSSLASGEAALSLTDYKIIPHWGKNPFNDPTATVDDTGGYELYLTPTGTEGHINELKLPNGITNTLILRMYQTDPILPKGFPIHFIEPPVLYYSRKLFDGRIQWTPFPDCSDAEMRVLPNLATTFYELNYPQNTGTLGKDIILRDFNCPLNPDQGNTSIVLFEGAWLGEGLRNLVARQSSDSPYLFYCINPHNNWRYYLNSIFRIRFKLSTFPDGLYQDVKVANRQDYDLRYFSIATGDGVLPQPTIAALTEREIREFYTTTGSWNGWVEVIVALDENKARECGFYDGRQIFLPLKSDRVNAAKSMSIIIRSTLANGPKTAGAASRACNKTVECGNPAFIRNIMQEYYPELVVYHCESGNGQAPLVTKYQDYYGHS